METDRNLRPLPTNGGSKAGDSLVDSIDGSPRASLGGNISAEGTNLAKNVEVVSVQAQARNEKELPGQTRFDREEVTESVIEQRRLQKLIIENDLLKHLFKAKMEYPVQNKSQNRLSSGNEGRGISGATGNGGNEHARPR